MEQSKPEIKILLSKGYKPISDLNFCTENGIVYYIGHCGQEAAVVAKIHDESLYIIDKPDFRDMAETARTKGINSVILFTNYGIELHSRHEKPQIVGFTKIEKINL